jgi:ribosomal protein S18 acetylase RimI-like enzyme
MAKFETYSGKTSKAGGPLALAIGPVCLEDLTALAEITADREGGSKEDHLPAIQRKMTLAQEGHGLLLVARHDERIVGFGTAMHFSPPSDSPADTAPAGWYLSGLIVAPPYRRRGVGHRLTAVRLEWIRERACAAFYFANARNRVSISLHERFGFRELTRTFSFPGACFEGGVGILFQLEFGISRVPRLSS